MDSLDKFFLRRKNEERAPAGLAYAIFDRVEPRPTSLFDAFKLRTFAMAFTAALLIFAGGFFGAYYRYYRITNFAAAFELTAAEGKSINVAPDASFVLGSSVALSEYQVQKVVRFEPEVPFRVDALGDNKYRITPEAPLATNQSYKIAISEGVADKDYSWGYQVAPAEVASQPSWESGGSDGLESRPSVAASPAMPASQARVDIKINGADSPGTVAYNALTYVSWTATGVRPNSCIASGHRVPLEDGRVWTSLSGQPADLSKSFYARHAELGFLSSLTLEVACTAESGAQVRDFVDLSVTSEQSSLTVNTPNGGEVFEPGDTILIRWKSAHLERANVDVEVQSSDKSQVLQLVRRAANNGEYVWTAPTDLKEGLYKVVVTAHAEQVSYTYSDESDNFFRIKSKPPAEPPASLTVTTPNGGESYTQGDTMQIGWKTAGFNPTTLTIDLEDAQHNATRLAQGGMSGFGFVIPDTLSPGQYKARVNGYEKASSKNIADMSDSFFRIAARPVAAKTDLIVRNSGQSGLVSAVTGEARVPLLRFTLTAQGPGELKVTDFSFILAQLGASSGSAVRTLRAHLLAGKASSGYELGSASAVLPGPVGMQLGSLRIPGNSTVEIEVTGDVADVPADGAVFGISLVEANATDLASGKRISAQGLPAEGWFLDIKGTPPILPPTVPSVSVLTPSGGAFAPGREVPISWKTNGFEGITVSLAIKNSAGQTVQAFGAANDPGEITAYPWLVPIDIAPGTYRVVISLPAGLGTAESGVFTVTTP